MKNNSIKTVVAVGIGAALFFCTGTFCGNSKPGSKHKYQLAVCSTCIVSSNVWTSSRRSDWIYRTCTDRFIMGRKSMVELGNHISICRCCDWIICKEAQCTGRCI